MNQRHIFLILGSCIAVLGCASVTTTARDQFSRQVACPKNVIRVTPRPDEAPHDLLLADLPPPVDVAADPGRVALWREHRVQEARRVDSTSQVVDVAGCDHRLTYVCGASVDSDEGNVGTCVSTTETGTRLAGDLSQFRSGVIAPLGVKAEDRSDGTVVITEVMPSGPAVGALATGDVLVEGNGVPVRSATELFRVAIVAARRGSAVDLVIHRGTATQTVRISPR